MAVQIATTFRKTQRSYLRYGWLVVSAMALEGQQLRLRTRHWCNWGAAIADRVAAPKEKYNKLKCSRVASRYNSRLPLVVITWSDDWMGSLWEERATCAKSILFHQTSQRKLINRQGADTDKCRYDHIWRGFLGMQWRWLYFVAGILRSTGLREDGPSGHSQETNWFSMYLRRAEVQLMCHIPTWEWTVFGCQTVPIGYDKYVIRSVSLFVHMVAAAVDALWAEKLTSSCQAFDFWLCNPRVSRRGRSEPGRPSGMPQECTWSTARVEECSVAGGGVRDI